MHVQEDDVGRLSRYVPESLLGGVSDIDPDALGTLGMGDLIQDHLQVVINEQDAFHNHRSTGRKIWMPC
jgi:hypothetical protein